MESQVDFKSVAVFWAMMELLARLRAFCFPGGEDAARGVRAIRDTQKGEMCAAPGAR